jgi:formamidopyrimidine-DNA glycosylase
VPELPEVETVRAGLQRFVVRRRIASVEITHPRSVRRHLAGAQDLAERLVGSEFAAASRRGKYFWLPLAGVDECLVAHLGMSGQMLVIAPGAPPEKHLHVRIRFDDGGPELHFVDQRTFGGMMIDQLVPAADQPDQRVPAQVAHIARDPLDPYFDETIFRARLRRRNSALKRALLDQTLVSGIGNIYADESLWRAKLHGLRLANGIPAPRVRELLGHVRAVLTESLEAGGTTFDSLYVDVNGESGYFERDLAVYGREGEPCRRCGTSIRRVPFMNRSSYFCPRCQRVGGRRNTDAQRRAC